MDTGSHFISNNKEILLRVMKTFSYATDIETVIMDTKGETLLTGEGAPLCEFCRLVRSSANGKKKCRLSYINAGKQAALYSNAYVFRCHGGLMAFAAPITVQNQHIATIICRNIIMWEIDDYFIQELSHINKELQVDFKDLTESLKELPLISANKVQAASTLLFTVANQIVQNAAEQEKDKQAIAHHQSLLNEQICKQKLIKKQLASVNKKIYGAYEYQKEKELIGKIKVLDRKGAYEGLLDALSDITQQCSGDPEVLKIRVFELLVMISRAVAETGTDAKAITNINVGLYREISRLTNAEEIAKWTVAAFDTFFDLIQVKSCSTNSLRVVESATAFIRENYTKNLTVEDVAAAVFVSRYHLSHLFKMVLDCSIGTYIQRVKVEKAKKLLYNPRNKIGDIAIKVGFNDANYFTKVFKKMEGITPSDFKKALY